MESLYAILLSILSLFGSGFTQDNKMQLFGAPVVEYRVTILPVADSLYDIGTSTNAFRTGFFDQLCLTADTCKTAWPAGSGSGLSSYDAFTHPQAGTSATTSQLVVTGASSTFQGIVFTIATGTSATTTNLTVTNLHIGPDFITDINGNGLSLSGAGVLTATLGTTVDLTSEVTGDLPFSSLAQVSANSVLANPTSATADAQSVATSTLFGANVTSGSFLQSNGSSWAPATTLGVANGGTGITSYTPGDILYASAATTLTKIASSTDGFVLGLSLGKPTWIATTTLSNITGTLTVSKGGTGQTTFTSSQLLYGNGTNALTSVGTSSLSVGTGLTNSGTLGSQVGGSAASISFASIAANSLWVNNTGASAVPAVISTSTLFAVINASTILQIPSSASQSPTLAGAVAHDTTSDQIKFGNGTVTKVLGNGNDYTTFTYATSTAWTGTTTVPLGPSFVAETWNGMMCFTDAGTLNVSLYDGTNRMNMMGASTTVGTFVLSTNNTFTATEKRYVDIGTPASSPTKISCTISRSLTAD